MSIVAYILEFLISFVLATVNHNVKSMYTVCMYLPFLQAGEFVQNISGSSSLYGLQKETLYSLLMSLLPHLKHEYEGEFTALTGETQPTDVRDRLMQTLLRALKENAGFQIPSVSNILGHIA